MTVCCCCRRYVATELPLRYRKLVANKSRCYVVIAGLWTAALITFIAPLPTKPDWLYYRYNVNEKICGIHWEYPSFCIITGLYIPILSGAVLVFTGLRIRAALRRRRRAQITVNQDTPQNSSTVDHQQSAIKPTVRRSYTCGSRRTLKILTFTSIAYFTFWSPYVFVTLPQMFFRSFKPPAAVDFTVMWLANTNSAVNVFIYSWTNTQFRRQCVLLASRLCCSRLSCLSSSEQPNPDRRTEPNVSTSLPIVRVSTTTNIQATVVHISDTNTPAIVVPSSSEDVDGGGAQLITVPRAQCLTVDGMKQDVSIETLASDEDEHC